MNKKILAIAITSVALSATSSHAEFKWMGFSHAATPKIGVQLTDGSEELSAKVSEYSDYRRSLLLGLNVTAAKDDGYWMALFADRMGLRDSNYRFSGGRGDGIKYAFYHSSIPHNLSSSSVVLVPYTYDGIRSITMPANGAAGLSSDLGNWAQTIHFETIQRNMGLTTSLKVMDPLTLDLGVAYNTAKGTRATSVGFGSSSSRGFISMPEPIDTNTNEIKVGAHFKRENFVLSGDGLLSAFRNKYTDIAWQHNNTPGNLQQYTLNPSNLLLKVGVKGGYYNLPLNSDVLARFNYSTTTSNWTITPQMERLSPSPGASVMDTLNLSAPVFQGNIAQGAFNVAWVAAPIQKLETKVYYNFLRKWNRSSQIDFDTTSAAVGESNEVFDYFKHDLGMNAKYALPYQTKVGAGYELLNTERKRFDASMNTDHTFYGQLSNSALDMLRIRLKVAMLSRSAINDNAELGAVGGTATDFNNYLLRYVRYVDTAGKIQKKVELGFEVNPLENLDLGLDLAYRDVDYTEGKTILGVTHDVGRSVNVDVGYTHPKWFKATAFGMVDLSTHDVASFVKSGSVILPGDTGTDTAYNWNNRFEETNWSLGLNVDIPVRDDLTVNAGVQQDRSRTRQHTTYDKPTPFTLAGDYFKADSNYDVYTIQTVSAKIAYQILKNLKADLGYRYQKMDYADDQIAQAVHYKALTNNALYYSGAYTDRPYDAHLVMASAQYVF